MKTPSTEGTTARRRVHPPEESYGLEIRRTVQKLLADRPPLGDLKIINTTLKEMRAALRVFGRYRHVRKVSVFGSARTQPGDPVFRLAEEFARRMADEGYMIITGAGPGIMEACQRGAGRERSFGVNIRLPHEQRPNQVIAGDEKLLTFKYFFTRKLFFIKEAHAVTLFPGGFGTHDEGFEALTLLQTGKAHPMPVVFLDRKNGTYWKTWERYVIDHLLRQHMIAEEDLALFLVTQDVERAVEEITRFYRVYHSSRYVHDLYVIRLNRPLSPRAVEKLNREFGDIVVEGKIELREAFPEEAHDAAPKDLPRLAFRFDRIHFGRLRMLIDRVNELGAN
ncbi:MAG: Rossman fold protein, TIGR00730 family [Candidatus Binatia bacterium]|nr:MAG: Rossman fold protein, TIGR00730 family [Candidatus Binatia bacterium]